ncbi:MAG: hypothetical protein KJ042_03345 [Deltaproteobacteria bacterium]|nr:hypothetical protein [Deltaproteobacteria bacterium]
MKRSVLGLGLLCTLALALGVFACDGGDDDGEKSWDQLSGEEDATSQCVALCQYALADDVDLSKGPCLSDKVVEDWVCDVAHNPRTDVDDLDTNQCDNYGKGASHYVEVTPDCEFIKAG